MEHYSLAEYSYYPWLSIYSMWIRCLSVYLFALVSIFLLYLRFFFFILFYIFLCFFLSVSLIAAFLFRFKHI